MISCGRFPCGMTSAGCSFGDCINSNVYRNPPLNPGYYVQPLPSGPAMGCICPPTSEKTCESPICPRKNHLKSAGSLSLPSEHRG